jgi:hypothetical protein
MLHILFSILISLGTFSSVNVTKVERVKKVDAEKQEVIWADVNEDMGSF